MVKALFIFEILTFLFWFYGYVENYWIRKLALILKFIISQTNQQIIVICLLSNIIRIKGNQTMKLGHLIEYNMGNIFLEKLYTKYGKKAIPRHFYKKSKLNNALDQQSEMF